MTNEQRRCVCPGSYDPVTMGHVDVITRAAALYDEVIVAVLYNPAKLGTFSVDDRIGLLDAVLVTLPNVRIEAFAGRLLVDVCREAGAGAILKGLRSDTDFAYELPMALMNRHLSGVETVFLPGDPRFGHVSSSLIKEVAKYGGDITGLVPDEVREALAAVQHRDSHPDVYPNSHPDSHPDVHPDGHPDSHQAQNAEGS